jgi:hypothetical protein
MSLFYLFHRHYLMQNHAPDQANALNAKINFAHFMHRALDNTDLRLDRECMATAALQGPFLQSPAPCHIKKPPLHPHYKNRVFNTDHSIHS